MYGVLVGRDALPEPPEGLGEAGRALWVSLTSVYVFTAYELLILDQACRLADSVDALAAAVEQDGVVVLGAAGQKRLNAAVVELRQARLGMAKLLGMLALPSSEDERPMSDASRRAQHAARSRWANHTLRSVGD